MIQFLLETGAATAEAGGMFGGGFTTQIVVFAIIFGMMYMLVMRPEKKKNKELETMRSSLEVGDEIITTGGIVGRVVSTKDDTLVIETTADRTKLRIVRGAIHTNNSFAERKKEFELAAKEKKERKEKAGKDKKAE